MGSDQWPDELRSGGAATSGARADSGSQTAQRLNVGVMKERRQGILPFMVELGDREEVTGRVGLTLVVEAARALGLNSLVSGKLKVAKRHRGASEYAKIEAMILLIAAGGDRVEDIRVLERDEGLMRLLGKRLPSPDALLRLLKAFDDPKVWEHRPEEEKSWVPPESEALQALFEVNRELVGRAASEGATTATVDHDGTIIEAHKRDALVAYEGTRGYQPLVAVWVEEDLIIGDEFRDGNVPGNKDPLSSVKRAMEALPPRVTKRYFRGDSADYYLPLLKYLVKEQVLFAISADMSQQLRERCEKVKEDEWEELENREREVVDVAEVAFVTEDWPKRAQPLRYVAIRFTPKQGELFPVVGRRPKYVAVVTNRPEPSQSKRCEEMSAAEVVLWHRGKAGTIEHVHRGMKDELGAGVLPCQRFGANAAWFRINVLTYNVLTFLKRCALSERYRDARPKRLRFELFTMPGRLVFHQRQTTVNISSDPTQIDELVEARRRLLTFYRAMNRRSQEIVDTSLCRV